MILSDCHLHSSHSGDSDTPMEEMIQKGIALGLKTMCFTEHNDFNFPETELDPAGKFELNADSYLYDLIRMKEKYEGQIRILYGVELGLQASCFRENAVFAKNHEFDFIIASSHLLGGQDPYYPEFFEGKSEEEIYRAYFEEEIANAKKFSNFDVYGHLDYIVRYGANKDADYSYAKYKDLLDKLLETLIEKGKGIEINTGGLRHGLREQNPCTDILKRYKELGGEIITIGSDAHNPQDMAYKFDIVPDLLKSCGFDYYTIFEKRNPEFHKI